MKYLSIFLGLLLLTGCMRAPAGATNVGKDHMKNPLVAEQYWSERTEVMVNLLVNEKDALTKAGLIGFVDSQRLESLKNSQEATKQRKDGVIGQFNSMKHETIGFVLVNPKTGNIFFGTTFETDPGPSLHLIFSESKDPRDLPEFPDKTSLDIGELSSPYGAQVHTFDPKKWNDKFNTLSIYDTKLKRLYGFVQLGKQI